MPWRKIKQERGGKEMLMRSDGVCFRESGQELLRRWEDGFENQLK